MIPREGELVSVVIKFIQNQWFQLVKHPQKSQKISNNPKQIIKLSKKILKISFSYGETSTFP